MKHRPLLKPIQRRKVIWLHLIVAETAGYGEDNGDADARIGRWRPGREIQLESADMDELQIWSGASVVACEAGSRASFAGGFRFVALGMLVAVVGKGVVIG